MTAPTSYLALARSYGITMLARSATWQSIIVSALGGVASEALGLSRIIEVYGGSPPKAGGANKARATDGSSFTMTSPYALAILPAVPRQLGGVGSYDYSGTVLLQLSLLGIQTGELTPDFVRRVANQADAICDEINALFGASGCLGSGAASSELLPLPDETGASRAEAWADITIDFDG
jgi:hypothetical protein